jgi:arginyl-tRNA synthetase
LTTQILHDICKLQRSKGMAALDPAIGPGEIAGIDGEREVSLTLEGNLLVEQNRALDQQVKAALEQKIREVGAEQLPAPSDYFINNLDLAINSTIHSVGYDIDLVTINPPARKNDATKGVDLAFNTIRIANDVGESGNVAASNLATLLGDNPIISSAEATGPFVNLGLNFQEAAPRILSEVATFGDKYGHFRDGDPKLVVIDYSSPNVAKNMTVAHLRSTIIGQSLMKIQHAVGNVPFGINHIGDWGTQFGSIIYEYRKEMAERGDDFAAEMEEDPTKTLMRIYRAFNERKNADPEAVQASQDIFLRLEQGDPELVELWSNFRQWSLRDFGPVYDRLRVKFDAIQGESFFEDRMATVVEEGLALEVLERDEEGSVVMPFQPLTDPTTNKVNKKIMLDANGEPRDELIVKPSGGTVYITRDLAAIRYRAQELEADRILYVVGHEQEPHFLKLFNMVHHLGYAALGRAEHVSFGLLTVDGKKMKSREGRVVLLNDILDQSTDAAADLLKTRKEERGEGSELTEEELEVARQIGVSALIFNDLKQDRTGNIRFEADAVAKALEPGKSSYIQYTDSRLKSMLEKIGELPELGEIPASLSDEEKRLLVEIARLPLVVDEAARHSAPHKLASYLTAFCQSINTFYVQSPVTKAATETEKTFRAHLVKASQQVIANTSDLLHIELPGKM